MQAFVLLCLVYTASVTPFELAFLWRDFEWGVGMPLAPSSGWVFVANRFVDAAFMCATFTRQGAASALTLP